MKKLIKYMALLVAVIGLTTGCTKVPPGYVGIKVDQFGSQKGVEDFPLKTGAVWYNPFTTDVEVFPTFLQTVIWTKNLNEGNAVDESISFNSSEGTTINADIACSVRITGDKVPQIYMEFRQDASVIMNGYIHNEVRNAFSRVASNMKAMDILGGSKSKLLDDVKTQLNTLLNPKGFDFDMIGFSGELRPDPRVSDSINAVIQQTQQANQAEAKVRQSEAEAKQVQAAAEGDAAAILVKAKAQADANELIGKSLANNPLVLQSIALAKWNGVLPTVTSGAIPFINVGSITNK
jgi:regulator of protease activity HflC (stomatin/prohibitin superfamily)